MKAIFRILLTLFVGLSLGCSERHTDPAPSSADSESFPYPVVNTRAASSQVQPIVMRDELSRTQFLYSSHPEGDKGNPTLIFWALRLDKYPNSFVLDVQKRFSNGEMDDAFHKNFTATDINKISWDFDSYPAVRFLGTHETSHGYQVAFMVHADETKVKLLEVDRQGHFVNLTTWDLSDQVGSGDLVTINQIPAPELSFITADETRQYVFWSLDWEKQKLIDSVLDRPPEVADLRLNSLGVNRGKINTFWCKDAGDFDLRETIMECLDLHGVVYKGLGTDSIDVDRVQKIPVTLSNSPLLAEDSSGDLWIAGATQYDDLGYVPDLLVVHWNPEGPSQITRIFDPHFPQETIGAVTIDADNRLAMIGHQIPGYAKLNFVAIHLFQLDLKEHRATYLNSLANPAQGKDLPDNPDCNSMFHIFSLRPDGQSWDVDGIISRGDSKSGSYTGGARCTFRLGEPAP